METHTTEKSDRCKVCKAFVDADDLFCSNCGAEAETGPVVIELEEQSTTHHFSCGGCGASMSYDASARALRCPFCGSDNLSDDQANHKTLRAKYVIPFNTTQQDITTALRQWMGKSYWRPSDLVSSAVITNVTPVYVPYWIFSAKTFTFWTADSSNVPWGARGDWMPVTGHHKSNYHGVIVGASSVLTQSETSSICPYNLDVATPAGEAKLDSYVVEQFRVQRKYARPLARANIEALEREACRRYVPGRARNVKVNVRLEEMIGRPVLFPVWILAYQYQGEVYRFLANGQTGKHSGTAPVSWQKIITWIAVVIILIVLAILLVGSLGVISQMFA